MRGVYVSFLSLVSVLSACALPTDRREGLVSYVGYNADILVEVALSHGAVVGGGFVYLRQPGSVWRWRNIGALGDGRVTFQCMVGVPSKALPMAFDIMVVARRAARLECKIVMSDSDKEWFVGTLFAWDWAMPEACSCYPETRATQFDRESGVRNWPVAESPVRIRAERAHR
jgi:hypothetical protein